MASVYQARGVYVRFSQTERNAIRAAQLGRLTNGDRTSMSALGKSSGKNFPMSPHDILIELDYADSLAANGGKRVQKVENDLTGYGYRDRYYA